MENQLTVDARRQLNRFCRQYLQLHLDIDFPSEELLRDWNFQECIYNTLYEEKSIKYAPPDRYQLRILKQLILRIEESIQDVEEDGISDDLMNALAILLSSRTQSETISAEQKSYVTYTLSGLVQNSGEPASITILESRNLLTAGGVTGFRTWEAAMHMGNYLCEFSSLINGKSILELGTGTGYLSILCAKYLLASQVLATDGYEDVVSNLSTNFFLNDLQDNPKIEGKELRWGHALVGSEHPKWNAGRDVDLVIASDVTYDRTWHPALISTFGELFDLHPATKILIASAVRNEETYKEFLDRCQSNKLLVEHIDFEMPKLEVQEGPFFSDLAPVKLCMITRL